jgi:hypothetical protein
VLQQYPNQLEHSAITSISRFVCNWSTAAVRGSAAERRQWGRSRRSVDAAGTAASDPNEPVLAKVRETTVPAIERHKPFETWIIDDTLTPCTMTQYN